MTSLLTIGQSVARSLRPRTVCFMIPVKTTDEVSLACTRRCIQSIRRLYPTEPIIVALAEDTQPLDVDTIIQVKNPYFSTMGCLYLFHIHHYADYAVILHDSMCVTSRLQNLSTVTYIYDFWNSLDMGDNWQTYRTLMTEDELQDMLRIQRQGCFGVALGIEHGMVQRCGLLRFVPLIKNKNGLCAMERIVAYLCTKANITPTVLCGDIEKIWRRGWDEKNLTLEDVLAKGYPECVYKTFLARG